MLNSLSGWLHGCAVFAEWNFCPVRAAVWGALADAVDFVRGA